jgi:starch phosphorylase
MWQHLWPGVPVEQVPITHVTNGVHLPTWMAPELQELLDRRLPRGWRQGEAAAWAAVEGIPEGELWAVRNALRAQLVQYVRSKTIADRLARGESISYVESAARTFDAGVLTLGFARRVALYKRLQLLIRDPGRALALLRGPRKIQVVIAGKAHPSDDGAKRLVQLVFGLKDQEGASAHVAFLEDYDIGVARQLVAGCDVWVNLPRPPMEASGTSGMKAALNGGLNLSVLDGWWAEAFDDRNGWALPERQAPDEEAQDAQDATAFYELVERAVVPAYYERDENGVPRAWVARIKASLRTAGSTFTTRRMVGEYIDQMYRPTA